MKDYLFEKLNDSTDAKVNGIERMSETLINILIQYGGIWVSIGVLAVISLSAWLGKVWATRINLRENEQFRASLQKDLDENQISYAYWYNEQAKVIQALYSQIAIVQIATQRYFDKASEVSLKQLELNQLQATFSCLAKAFSEGNTFYQKSKILIPEHELKNLDDFWDKTRKIVSLGLSIHNKNDVSKDISCNNKIEEGKAYLQSCAEQLDCLRCDFREILKGKIQ